jgi:hypothetical protein
MSSRDFVIWDGPARRDGVKRELHSVYTDRSLRPHALTLGFRRCLEPPISEMYLFIQWLWDFTSLGLTGTWEKLVHRWLKNWRRLFQRWDTWHQWEPAERTCLDQMMGTLRQVSGAQGEQILLHVVCSCLMTHSSINTAHVEVRQHQQCRRHAHEWHITKELMRCVHRCSEAGVVPVGLASSPLLRYAHERARQATAAAVTTASPKWDEIWWFVGAWHGLTQWVNGTAHATFTLRCNILPRS